MSGEYGDNVFFIGDFEEDLERNVLIPLTLEIRTQSIFKHGGQIDLYINSHGGNGHLANHLIELVEVAKRKGVIVRTIVTDSAFSAGSMLAVTGSPGERYIAKGAFHLVHYGSIQTSETTPLQAERYGKWKTNFFESQVRHYKKYCNIPNLEEEIKDDGFFVTAKEAIKWGMADAYMTKLDFI